MARKHQERDTKIDIRHICRGLDLPDQRIAAIAARQRGLITLRQLRACGADRHRRKRRVHDGRLHQVQPGVFALVAWSALSHEARMLAVAMSLDGIGAIGGQTAGAVTGIWRGRVPDDIDVVTTVPVRPRPGTRVAPSTTFDPVRDVRDFRGITVTNGSRTIVDLARDLSWPQLTNSVYRGVQRRQVDLDVVDQVVARNPRHRGSAKLQRALAEYRAGSAGSRSFLEDRWIATLKRLDVVEPLICRPTNFDAGDSPELDTVWLPLRLVVEVDGPTTHSQPRDVARDREVADRLGDAGWTLVRLSEHQVDAPPTFLVDLLPKRRRRS